MHAKATKNPHNISSCNWFTKWALEISISVHSADHMLDWWCLVFDISKWKKSRGGAMNLWMINWGNCFGCSQLNFERNRDKIASIKLSVKIRMHRLAAFAMQTHWICGGNVILLSSLSLSHFSMCILPASLSSALLCAIRCSVLLIYSAVLGWPVRERDQACLAQIQISGNRLRI